MRIVLGAVMVLMALIAALSPPPPDPDPQALPPWVGVALFSLGGLGLALWGWFARRSSSVDLRARRTPYASYLRRGPWVSGIGVTIAAISVLVVIGGADVAMSFVVRGVRARADVLTADCDEVRSGRSGTSVRCAMELRILYPDRPPATMRMDEIYEEGIEWADRPVQIWVVYDSADPSHVTWRTQQVGWSFVVGILVIALAVISVGIWMVARSSRRRRMVRRWLELASDPTASSRRADGVIYWRSARHGSLGSGLSLAMRDEVDGGWHRVELLEPHPTGSPADLFLRGELRDRGLVVPFDGDTPLWPRSAVRRERRPMPPPGETSVPVPPTEVTEVGQVTETPPAPARSRGRWVRVVVPLAVAGIGLLLYQRGNSALLSEDFDDGEGSFATSATDLATAAYEDGEYVITIVDPAGSGGLPYAAWTDSVAAVRARGEVTLPVNATGPTYGGITVLTYTAKGYYLFAVGSDGSYFVSGVPDLQEPDGALPPRIASGEPGTIADVDAPMMLQLDVVSEEGRTAITASVNGEEIVTRTLSAGEPTFNGLGVYVHGDSAGTVVRFDDLVASRL